jgi:DNA-binding FrmR family transcriptional regulator
MDAHEHRRRDDVARRLARVAGHVASIRDMVADDRSCTDILQQMAAAMKGLEAARKELLADHLETCIIAAAEDGRVDEAVGELRDTLRLVLR